jgi:hypothetical protein
MNSPSSSEVESPTEDAAEPQEESSDSRPLERMEIEFAENGVVVTHHPRASDRVKMSGLVKPKKHVFEDKDEAAKHLAKNIHRLKN